MFWAWMIFGAFTGALAAQRKGFGTAAGVLGGAFLGFLAPLMFFVTATKRRCPACAELIQKQATICPHCRTAVAPTSV